MASANVELLRSIFDDWQRGDFSSTAWANPEIEFVFADGPSPGSWNGLAEMGDAWRDFLGSWERLRAVPGEYRELDGERVLVFIENTGRGKISGLELGEMRSKSANLFEIRDGKVKRLVAYWDRERALEDIGVGAETERVDTADDEIGEILVEAEELETRVADLASEISHDYSGRDLLLVGILKGAIFFLSDLMRALTVPCEVDFMALASYGSSTDSSGVVRILKDLDAPIEGRDVVIVEDIVDSGLTLSYLLRTLEARQPVSLEVCALLTKPERRKVELPIRYVGFEIENRFVIGYGLDHAQRFRNLPYVAVLNEG